MIESLSEPRRIRRWVRVLAVLLVVVEPLDFGIAAMNAVNAVRVRGTPVLIVLALRLAATVLCVIAGRALLDGKAGAIALARATLVGAAATQLFAGLTTYFPSNRLPGDAPFYGAITIAYYGAWLTYLRRMTDVFTGAPSASRRALP